MARNIKDAVKLYSGDKPLELFVDKLPKNLEGINTTYKEIKELFNSEGIKDFEKVPDDNAVSAKFVSLFNDFNEYLDAVRFKDLYGIKKYIHMMILQLKNIKSIIFM